jgi:hypothetical protein
MATGKTQVTGNVTNTLQIIIADIHLEQETIQVVATKDTVIVPLKKAIQAKREI